MNIFTPDAFIGDARIEEHEDALRLMLKQAKRLRIKLGEQGYLIDKYLEHLIEGANVKSAADSAEDGRVASDELYTMCIRFTDGQDITPRPPEYKTVREHIASHPLRRRESHTEANIHAVNLMGKFLTGYCKKYIADLNASYENAECRDCYDKMTHILGGDSELKEINTLFVRCFVRQTVMEQFLNGYNYGLYCQLMYRDNETGRLVFQLIMDSIEE